MEVIGTKNKKGTELINDLYDMMMKNDELDIRDGLFYDVSEFLYNGIRELETGEDQARWEWLLHNGDYQKSDFK